MTAPVPTSPLSSPIAVEDAWIDYNGHLNMAYYSVIFDRALEEILVRLGLGKDYMDASGCTYMALEAHIRYLREVFRTDPVRVGLRVLDVDAKRMHLFCEMRHAGLGELCATSEWMFLHVDMTTRRAAPWPPALQARLEALQRTGAAHGWPEGAGRRVGMPPRADDGVTRGIRPRRS